MRYLWGIKTEHHGLGEDVTAGLVQSSLDPGIRVESYELAIFVEPVLWPLLV